MIPGVKSGRKPTKEEARAFHESEANCNTCRHMVRAPMSSAERIARLHRGHCGMHPYGDRFTMIFAPDDWMGMRCWE